jgi:hypothetical protein
VSTSVGGMDIEMKIKMGLDMSWHVQKVDDKGNAKIRMTLGRVKLSMQGPMGNVEIDSADKKAADSEDEVAKAFAGMATALAALEITFTMTPEGDMKDTKFSEEALKKLRASPGAEQFGGQLLSPDAFKQTAGGGVVLPKGPVTKGKQWTQKMTMKIPSLGTMSGDTKFTYEGPVDRDGKKLEKIRISPNFKIESDSDAPFQVKMKVQKGKGNAYFDNQAGRLVESTNDMTLEMEIEAGGMTVPAQIQGTNVLRLMNRPRPRPR